MVKVVGAPGYEDFRAQVVLEATRQDGVEMSIVVDLDDGEIIIVRSQYVHEMD